MGKKITPDEVGRHLGLAGATIRRKMEDGSLPIGDVDQCGERKQYIIYPKPLYEVTGLALNGYEPPKPEVNYSKLAEEIKNTLDYNKIAGFLMQELIKKARENE